MPMTAIATDDPLLSPTEAAAEVPPGRNGRPVHASTISRWIRMGVTIDRTVIRLPAVRYPSGWKIRPSDLERFLRRLTAAAIGEDPDEAAPPTRT